VFELFVNFFLFWDEKIKDEKQKKKNILTNEIHAISRLTGPIGYYQSYLTI
jgi:hypothetical protein